MDVEVSQSGKIFQGGSVLMMVKIDGITATEHHRHPDLDIAKFGAGVKALKSFAPAIMKGAELELEKISTDTSILFQAKMKDRGKTYIFPKQGASSVEDLLKQIGQKVGEAKQQSACNRAEFFRQNVRRESLSR